MRARFAGVGLAGLLAAALAVGLIAVVLPMAVLPALAQESTPDPFAPVATRDPFSFAAQPTIIYGTPTAPPALSGVAGYAERGAVSIRSGPGLEYPRIGGLAAGRSIDIIGYNGYDLNRVCSPNFQADLDMWVMVSYRGRTGWMARCALTIRGEFNMSQFIMSAPPPGSRPPTGYPITPTPGG